MKLQGNNVLIAPMVQANMTRGGIHLLKKYEPEPLQFRVLAVGPGRVVRKKGKPDVRIPPEVEPGDCVLLHPIHGNKFAYEDGTGRLIIEHDEIVAKWRPEVKNEPSPQNS